MPRAFSLMAAPDHARSSSFNARARAVIRSRSRLDHTCSCETRGPLSSPPSLIAHVPSRVRGWAEATSAPSRTSRRVDADAAGAAVGARGVSGCVAAHASTAAANGSVRAPRGGVDAGGGWRRRAGDALARVGVAGGVRAPERARDVDRRVATRASATGANRAVRAPRAGVEARGGRRRVAAERLLPVAADAPDASAHGVVRAPRRGVEAVGCRRSVADDAAARVAAAHAVHAPEGAAGVVEGVAARAAAAGASFSERAPRAAVEADGRRRRVAGDTLAGVSEAAPVGAPRRAGGLLWRVAAGAPAARPRRHPALADAARATGRRWRRAHHSAARVSQAGAGAAVVGADRV
jgi:hypothetical protein